MRAQAIRDAGSAEVIITDRNYDDTVRYTAALAKEKGLYLNPQEWDAFVAKVKNRLHDYFTDDELEVAIDEALADNKS